MIIKFDKKPFEEDWAILEKDKYLVLKGGYASYSKKDENNKYVFETLYEAEGFKLDNLTQNDLIAIEGLIKRHMDLLEEKLVDRIKNI